MTRNEDGQGTNSFNYYPQNQAQIAQSYKNPQWENENRGPPPQNYTTDPQDYSQELSDDSSYEGEESEYDEENESEPTSSQLSDLEVNNDMRGYLKNFD